MITNKQLSIIVIVIGILVVSLTFGAKAKEDFYIDTLMDQMGNTCVLESGYCLHNDRNWTGYILGWSGGFILIFMGVYLFFFDKRYELFKQEQVKFSKELASVKRSNEFKAYLAAFSDEEQAILNVVHKQEGITQSTLRFKLGVSKTALSLLLASLEKRDVISRKVVGKNKEIYLRKKF